MNTTAKGNAFRSHVLDLLRTKYPDAQSEEYTGWKKADITFSGMDFGRRTRFGVECKNYERKLTTKDFTAILMDYEAAFATQAIDILLVISKHDIEAASRQYVSQTPRLRFMTYSELEDWIIGIRSYAEAIAEVFTSDEVHAYYVDGRFEHQTLSAFESIRSWIDQPGANGLAVLGGYGLGKSSLAKRIASDQAKRFLSNPTVERIPILLKLGQVVHETELSALFGKHFTDQHYVEGYKFKTLMHLNSAGRLLIILDGFDEMKHAMTEADFRSNFREFNKLRTDQAKVLLLGRPSAFTSESSDLLIKGLGRIAGQSYPDSDFPSWIERTLCFFTREEEAEFLTKFLRHSQKSDSQFNIESRVSEVMADVHDDILQRPVQARIVGQLAASPSYSFKDTNRFKLYEDFILRVIERDQEKPARRKIPKLHRRRFLDELAWWSWTRDSAAQGVFRKDEVPQSIFDQFSNGEAIDEKSKRSEYLVSSLTEQKDSDVLYFAHRSFQEFLVASWISDQTQIDQKITLRVSASLNFEVFDFLLESEKRDYLYQHYLMLNHRLRGPIVMPLLLLIRESKEIMAALWSKSVRELTIYDALIVGYELGLPSAGMDDSRISWLENAVRNAPILVADCAFFCLLCLVVAHDQEKEVATTRVLALAWERILSGVSSDAISERATLVDQQHFGLMGQIVRNTCKKTRNLQGRGILWAPENACHTLLQRIEESGKVSGLAPRALDDPQIVPEIHVDGISVEKFLPQDSAKLFARIFAVKGDAFNLVSRAEKGPNRSTFEV